MIKETITVKSRRGLTFQQIVDLSQTATGYDSRILIQKNNKTANVKSIISMAHMNFSYGDKLEITVDGADEDEAFPCILSLFTGS